ncbi:MAG: S-layer homology domain-containing protein, partial [Lachnospiraceae bacterium]
KNYKGGSFKDVKAKAYYAPYVNWAVKLGIVKGKSQTLFEPAALVSRQEMAVILANYAKVMKFDLPKTREEIKYLDESSIDAGAKEAVTALQMAGILMGKEGNRLDPTGIATRAEVAALLVRYRELVLDSTTAQGLEVNDSGQLLYYEQGHLFTGTKVIDGRTYYFGTDGICFRIEE